ncbi:biotin--[acetyl-CoA-carboxylase] ligase [Candidatus Nitrosocosmicus arcticus]|uniref:Biotin-[acetyl-CoA-carboxylase] ligase n=1 Tax=Candidatus Nitrosocosmicus arcticus TaxID=2035267 RepID=A0A557ST94_9ARCH|nr:biotin--[acetyl-CoA-carboxylase] ligase [Candidatus Nitrosocosmicus arcticus]TVP39823.1 biotin-[acetyl-CoA-carboxylase] ligase [Candidatus Nitrosocosmicus arcticus]
MIKILCSDKDKFRFISNLVTSSDDSFIFKHFFYFDSIKSTQDFAYELLKDSDDFYASVIISDFQTGGKGRKGPNWASPIGGIWMSLALETNLKTHELFRILILVTRLLCQSLESHTKLKTMVKWPNDILVNGKKVAGILLDAEVEGDSIKQVIVGIGINSNNDLDSTKLLIKDKNIEVYDYDITTIKYENQNIGISNHDFIHFFLKRINDAFPKLKSSVFAEELTAYYKIKIMESQKHLKYRFSIGGNKFRGEIIKVYNDGSLLVKNLESNHYDDLIKINSAYDLSNL